MTEAPLPSSDPYVTHHAWLRHAARIDAIDEVADSVERRATPPVTRDIVQPSLRGEPIARWPRHSSGWRSAGRLHPRPEREPA